MPEQKRLNVDLDKSLYRKFRQKAFDEELPMTDVTRRLIKLWLEGEVTITSSKEPPREQ